LLIDKIHLSAQRIGAVNCVVRKDGALVGHNTDQDGIFGALDMLDTHSSADVPPIERRPAVVVGAGGSARAAVHTLPGCSIVNRTRARAEALAREFGATVAEITALREAALVVNCTSVGLRDDAVPFDVAQLRPDAIVLDLVYRGPTGETALVKAARARGLQAIDGVAVLVHQAIASLEAWLERDDLYDLYEPLREAALA
jgi:shikimate dehydrogenase